MIHIAVCCSKAGDRAALQYLLQRCMQAWSVDSDIVHFSSGSELLQSFLPMAYAMIFLDTDLCDMPGMEAARRIRTAGETCPLFFVSESPKEVLTSYSVHAAGFFIKPVQYEELHSMLLRHRHAYQQGMRLLEVVYERATYSIFIADLLYVGINGRTSVLYTRKGNIATNRAIGELAEQLCNEPFLRCHRSYLVHIHHIVSLGPSMLVMDNSQELPVSAQRIAVIRDILFERTGSPLT